MQFPAYYAGFSLKEICIYAGFALLIKIFRLYFLHFSCKKNFPAYFCRILQTDLAYKQEFGLAGFQN